MLRVPAEVSSCTPQRRVLSSFLPPFCLPIAFIPPPIYLFFHSSHLCFVDVLYIQYTWNSKIRQGLIAKYQSGYPSQIISCFLSSDNHFSSIVVHRTRCFRVFIRSDQNHLLRRFAKKTRSIRNEILFIISILKNRRNLQCPQKYRKKHFLI